MLQIFLIRSQWGLAVLLTRFLEVLPLELASLKWQLAIKKSWKIVSTQLIIWPRKKDHTVIFLI